jgi:glucose-6-phosphate 1-dehydrogenase
MARIGLDKTSTEIHIKFKPSKFNRTNAPKESNEVIFVLHPKESVSLGIINKIPGFSNDSKLCHAKINYDQDFEGNFSPSPYETLILGVLKGDKSDFICKEEAKQSCKIMKVFH